VFLLYHSLYEGDLHVRGIYARREDAEADIESGEERALGDIYDHSDNCCWVNEEAVLDGPIGVPGKAHGPWLPVRVPWRIAIPQSCR
jgi:hypothetical protein